MTNPTHCGFIVFFCIEQYRAVLFVCFSEQSCKVVYYISGKPCLVCAGFFFVDLSFELVRVQALPHPVYVRFAVYDVTKVSLVIWFSPI